MWRWIPIPVFLVIASASVCAEPFDGRWHWQVTLNNQCSSVVFDDLLIQDGKIKSKGRHYVGRFNITGSVTDVGSVSLYGNIPRHQLTGAGTLQGLVGRGEMSIVSGRGDCNGTWIAEKAE